MFTKRRKIICFILFIAGLLVSIYLTLLHRELAHKTGGMLAAFCSLSEKIDCNAVLTSKYAKVYDIPVAAIGAVAYLLMLVLLFLSTRPSTSRRNRYLAYMSFFVLVSFVYSFYMACISIFVLKKICIFCSSLYVINIALLVAVLPLYHTKGETFVHYLSKDIKYLFSDVKNSVITLIVISLLTGGFFIYRKNFKKRTRKKYVKIFNVDDLLNGKVPRFAVNYEGFPAMGPDTAPVTIVEFSDFECSFCQKAAKTLKIIMKKFTDKVRLVYMYFPLEKKCFPQLAKDFHPGACDAAKLAAASDIAGNFWEVQELLFEGPHPWTQEGLSALMEKLDTSSKLKKIYKEDEAVLDKMIFKSVIEGQRMRIRRTPTFFINGMRVDGILPEDIFSKVIEAELERSK